MAFKMKGSPMKRNFGVGVSPMKQTKKTDYTYVKDGEETTKKVITETGRENKKGQSQEDVMNMRWAKLEKASKAANAGIITKDGKKVNQAYFNKQSEAIQAKMLKDQQALIDNAKLRVQQFEHSADSTSNVNRIIDESGY